MKKNMLLSFGLIAIAFATTARAELSSTKPILTITNPTNKEFQRITILLKFTRGAHSREGYVDILNLKPGATETVDVLAKATELKCHYNNQTCTNHCGKLVIMDKLFGGKPNMVQNIFVRKIEGGHLDTLDEAAWDFVSTAHQSGVRNSKYKIVPAQHRAYTGRNYEFTEIAE